jgi:hypothetical protein
VTATCRATTTTNTASARRSPMRGTGPSRSRASPPSRRASEAEESCRVAVSDARPRARWAAA